jgi:DNA-binding IclR family transcriptional regulator
MKMDDDLGVRKARQGGGPETEANEAARSRNIATLRVLNVLSAFAFERPSFGVTDLAGHLGMTKNMVHRALATLVDQGFLVRDASGTRYELGFGVLALQNPYFPAPDFRTLAGPCLRRLHEISGGTAQLSVRAGDFQVVIDGVEGFGVMAIRTKIGVLMPLHASAASRAILSALPDQEIEADLKRNAPLKRFTENTLTEPAQIWKEVRAIRARGCAEGLEDHSRGGHSVSFYVLGADGLPHGAVTVGGPKSRFTPERMKELMPEFVAAVNDLRRQAALYEVS